MSQTEYIDVVIFAKLHVPTLEKILKKHISEIDMEWVQQRLHDHLENEAKEFLGDILS